MSLQLFSVCQSGLVNNLVHVKTQSSSSHNCATSIQQSHTNAHRHKVRISSSFSFFMHFPSAFLSSFPMSLHLPLPKSSLVNCTETRAYQKRNMKIKAEKKKSKQHKNLKTPLKMLKRPTTVKDVF